MRIRGGSDRVQSAASRGSERFGSGRRVKPRAWVAGTLALALVAGTLLAASGGAEALRHGEHPARISASDVPSFDPTHLLPKAQTGVPAFLEANPEADGRGIVVAIFDTGVDPGAPGLQVTTDGRPKVIDLVDASGSGDVDTTTRVTPNEDGTITGLSGRTLTLNPEWTNPSEEFRVGLKAAYDLFPRPAVNRVRRERGDEFAEVQRPALAEARSVLAAFDRDHPRPTRAQLEEREELAARVELLESKLASDLPDPGPVYDCLVWHDGERWMAAVDTDQDGDFTNEKAMTNFRDGLEYATFAGDTLVNFAVNIYDEGDTLSIVVDCGDHGTHVAGIVAAHHPDRPEINGVAPGAQIVGIKIGDTRLGSSSHNTSEIRALVATLRNNATVINKSYGGSSPFPNVGRIVELQERVIRDHGVVYVASAGNSGPAMTTAGSPGGTTSAIIGVGATVDEDMARAQYGLRRAGATTQFTWSSRGPTLDGDFGVDVTAPGGAFAPVPNWSLRGVTQMNGTSMSSPHVAGAVALLRSAAAQHGIDPSPEAIKRALQATANPIDGMTAFDVGAGMIDVPAAWAHLKNHAGLDDDAAHYDVRVGESRGVYLREPHETDRAHELRVSVTPRFPEKHDRESMVGYEGRVTLRTDAEWIETASSMLLTTGGGGFGVRVDPRELEPGVHVATVDAFDADRPERGPIFRLPVTVVRPMHLTRDDRWRHRETLEMGEGEIVRCFYAVPTGATWADLTLRRLDSETGQTLIVQTVQLLQGESFDARESRGWIGFEDGDETLRSIAVEGGRTLEVAIARNWSGLEDVEFEYEIRFRGLRPSSSTISMMGGAGVVPIDVTAPFRREHLEPRGSLTHHRRVIRPSDWRERPVDSPREVLPEGRIPHELVVEFPLKISDDGTYAINPAATMQPFAWASYEGFLWMILDADGRREHFGGYYGRDVELKKGDYTVQLQFRHEDASALEPMRTMPLFVDRRLPSAIRLTGSDSPEAAQSGRAMRSTVVGAGDTARVWIKAPDGSAIPRDAEPGDVLMGSMTFGGGGGDLVGATARPGGWPVLVTVPPKVNEKRPPRASDGEAKDERGALDKVAEAVRDLKVERLRAMGRDDQEAFDSLKREILREWAEHLPVLSAVLDRRVKAKDADTPEGRAAIVAAADEVIGAIDRGDLAAHFGLSIDDNDPEQKRERAEMTKKRDALIEALHQKAKAKLAQARESGEASDREAFEAAERELARWADLSGNDYFELRLGKTLLEGRQAVALGMIHSRLGDRPSDRKALRKQRVELLEALGWSHWAERAEAWRVLHEPTTKPRF